MKGVIALCTKELIVKSFGEDKWKKILSDAGLETEPLILPISNVDDSIIMNIVKSGCKILNLTLEQFADAFGDYWINVYSQRMYKTFYSQSKNAKEFLLNMDNVHKLMTKNMEGATPPHFEYETPSDNVLIMKYFSKRGLIDFVVGLVKGVAKYYKEDVNVKKLDNQRVEITFK